MTINHRSDPTTTRTRSPASLRHSGLKSPSKLREVNSVIHAKNYSMEVRADPFESAKSHFFDTSSWGEFCDVTLTLKQTRQPDSGGWVKIDDYRADKLFGTS